MSTLSIPTPDFAAFYADAERSGLLAHEYSKAMARLRGKERKSAKARELADAEIRRRFEAGAIPVQDEQDEQGEPRYPEHEKLKAVREKSQAIGEFLDTSGYVLCRHRYEGDNGRPRSVWKAGREKDWPPRRSDYIDGRAEHNPDFDEWNEGLEPVGGSIQRVLAEYFGIDQAKIDAEKEQMLAELRGEVSR